MLDSLKLGTLPLLKTQGSVITKEAREMGIVCHTDTPVWASEYEVQVHTRLFFLGV